MSWLWCPMPTPVARMPRTRKGWALAWYLTSFLTGSGMKYRTWATIWGMDIHVSGPPRVPAYMHW